MDAFLQPIFDYLSTKGDWAFIAGIEFIVIVRMAQIILRQSEARIAERIASEIRTSEAMKERAAGDKELALAIQRRGR